jgi:hypothetical protein
MNNNPIKIFITTWHRTEMLERCLREIKERTKTPHEVIVFDNGSDADEVKYIKDLHTSHMCDSIILWPHNTGPYFPKAVFYSLTTPEDTYYVSNDADTYPPKVSPDWLARMIAEMDIYQDIGVMSPQLPPQCMLGPKFERGNHVVCTAVGNQLSMVRRAAWPVSMWPQESGKFGDDSLRSKRMEANGFKTAYMKDTWCMHGGQCKRWGYTEAQIAEDPRKAEYGEPYAYEYLIESYEPTDPNLKNWRKQ